MADIEITTEVKKPVEIFTPMKAALTEFCREERQWTCEAIKAVLEK